MGERRGRVGGGDAVKGSGKDISISGEENGSAKGKKGEWGASRGRRC